MTLHPWMNQGALRPVFQIHNADFSGDVTVIPACGCELLHPEPIRQDCGAPAGDEEG